MKLADRIATLVLVPVCMCCAASLPDSPQLVVSGAPTALLTVAPPSPPPPPAVAVGPSMSSHPPLAPSPRPPLMGWTSWSLFRRDVDEKDIKAQADVLASKLAAAGYVYVNIDGGWFDCCDDHGRVKADAQKFPGGIAGMASYVHAKGLKFGIYLHPGVQKAAWDVNAPVAGASFHVRDFTDSSRQGSRKPFKTEPTYRIDFGKPGSTEFIQSEANLLASWGVDYLKLDFVGSGRDNPNQIDNRDEVAAWFAALQKSGRSIWFELSLDLDFTYAAFWKAHANGWRITKDIEGKTEEAIWHRMMVRFERAPQWVPFAGPGGWNDFDALQIGDGDAQSIGFEERRTMMTLWSISCSPLILGSDLTHLDQGDLAMLTNPEVIEIDQAGHPAAPIVPNATEQVWHATNPDGSHTVALFNLGNAPAVVTVYWSQLGFSGAASVRDVWTRTELGRFEGGFQVSLARHASELLRVFP